jgi:hypothetical protein
MAYSYRYFIDLPMLEGLPFDNINPGGLQLLLSNEERAGYWRIGVDNTGMY